MDSHNLPTTSTNGDKREERRERSRKHCGACRVTADTSKVKDAVKKRIATPQMIRNQFTRLVESAVARALRQRVEEAAPIIEELVTEALAGENDTPAIDYAASTPDPISLADSSQVW